MSDPAPKRRRFQFGTKFLLALITGGAIGGWMSVRENKEAKTRAALLRELEDRRALFVWESANKSGDIKNVRTITLRTDKLKPGELSTIKSVFPEAQIVELQFPSLAPGLRTPVP